jgi:predicted kinase
VNRSVGTPETRLIVLRGNSASGKSTVAREIRARYGRGIAIVGQDNVRRDILKERDEPGAANIGLIDLTARYALDHGFHVIVEGILYVAHYGEMLRALARDHRGVSRFFYLDVSFPETLRRHATKPKAAEYGETEMRAWFRPGDLLGDVGERIIPETVSLDHAVAGIMCEAEFV